MSEGPSQAAGKSAKPSRPSIREIGPAWITAIATLIIALTGTGFFIGQKSAQTGSAPSGQNAAAASGQRPKKASATPSSDTATSGVLLTRTSVTLSSNYGITFGSGPLSPQQAEGDLGFSLTALNELDFSNGRFSVFEGSAPTYRACATDQLYISGGETESYSTGSVFCFVGHGVVAAATISDVNTDDSSPINYVKLDVIVWKGS